MIFVVIMTTQKVFKNSLHSHEGEIMDGPLLRTAKASLDRSGCLLKKCRSTPLDHPKPS